MRREKAAKTVTLTAACDAGIRLYRAPKIKGKIVNTLTLAILVVIILFLLSSIICVLTAKKKGQNLNFWALMGLLFGPGAIGAMYFTDTDLPRSNNNESLNDRVKYFYDLGFLNSNKTLEEVSNEIRLKQIDDWGESCEARGIIDDYMILEYGSGKILKLMY